MLLQPQEGYKYAPEYKYGSGPEYKYGPGPEYKDYNYTKPGYGGYGYGGKPEYKDYKYGGGPDYKGYDSYKYGGKPEYSGYGPKVRVCVCVCAGLQQLRPCARSQRHAGAPLLLACRGAPFLPQSGKGCQHMCQERLISYHGCFAEEAYGLCKPTKTKQSRALQN